MRWIFFSLVFANLLLLVVYWQQESAPAAPAAAVNMPADARPLLLVSEVAETLRPAEHKKTVATPGRDDLCYVGGPYADELDARHLLARVSAVGLTGHIKTVEVSSDKPADYWVHVPPRSSREEALRVLKELQKRKFDSYIITQGDLAEGVSLGLFRNKESAYGLRQQVEDAGIPAAVRVVNHAGREYWVEVVEVSQLNERMRERIQAGDTEISWELVECSPR